MANTFTLNFPSEATVLIQKVQGAIAKAGGNFEGNTDNGNFVIPTPVGKVKGIYAISGQDIKVDITDKPIFVGLDMIRNEFSKYLGAI